MGGPLREFFTLTMKRFPDIPTLILGKAGNVFLKMMPESFRKGDYYLLGQLVGMSIIKIGKGPECFSASFLKAMYHLPFVDDDIEIEDAELMEKVKKLENGDPSELVDFDIPLTGDIAASKKNLVASFLILKNFSAIEQTSKGLGSIDHTFTDVANLEYMEFFLSPQQHDLTLRRGGRIECPKEEKYSIIFIKQTNWRVAFFKIYDLIPPPTIRHRRINTDIFTDKAKSYV